MASLNINLIRHMYAASQRRSLERRSEHLARYTQKIAYAMVFLATIIICFAGYVITQLIQGH